MITKPIPYNQELLRKALHMSSLVIPIAYAFLTKEQILMLMVPITLLVAGVEMGRIYLPVLNKLYIQLFGKMLRSHEVTRKKFGFSGATPLMISILATIAVFPKEIAISSIIILLISDSLAALVGRKIGRHKFMGKSLEGSAAFLLSAIIIILIIGLVGGFSGAFVLAGITGAAIACLVELVSARISIDDNFSIPLSAGITMWIVLTLVS